MATVGQFDYCVLTGLAYISALDMGSGVTLGKEFISDVSFIILHNLWLTFNPNWPPLAILNNRRMRRGRGGGGGGTEPAPPPQKKKKKKLTKN